MMRLNKSNSQIATIITFIIAVMFIFTLITLNISKISQKKINIDNTADSLGMSVASHLGSIGNAYKHAMEVYGEGAYNCEINWKLIVSIPLLVAGVIAAVALTIFSGGTLGPVAAFAVQMGVQVAIGVALSGVMLGASGVVAHYAADHPAASEQIKIKFSALSDLQQIIETPVQGAILSMQDDPAFVPDTFDMDRDNDTTDEVPRVLKWYNLRLNYFLNNLSMLNAVSAFMSPATATNSLFKDASGQFRFYIDENMDTLTVKKGADFIRWLIDADGDGIRELQVVPWMRDVLAPLLKELRLGGDYGYGINVRVDARGEIYEINDREPNKYEGTATYFTSVTDGVNDYDYTSHDDANLGALGNLISEIEGFENIIPRGLYDMDIDSAASAVGAWLGLLYNVDHEDWYTQLGDLRQRLSDLRTKLIERRNQIHDCVFRCRGNAWLSCVDTPLCRSVGIQCRHDWICDTWTQVCDGWTQVCDAWDTSTDPATCTSYADPSNDPCNSYADPSNDICATGHWDDGWEGCCGAPSNCGLACGVDGRCPARANPPCVSPLSGRNLDCCDVALLEPGCANNIITDSNAIIILNRLRNDITTLRNLIFTLYNNVRRIERDSYRQMREDLYLWSDYVGGVTSTKEKINHVIFVRIACTQDPNTGFIMPHIKTKTHWKWWAIPETCVGVANASGDFWLTLARFDESPTQSAPLLTRFRNFLFSKLGYRASEKALLDRVTTALQNRLSANTYSPIPAADRAQLITLLRNRGIITRVHVHYGAGTSAEDQSTVSPQEENRQIYIMGTESRIDLTN